MIDTDILREVRHIISHHNCPDGIASALILHDALPEARVTFVQYGTAEYEQLPAEPGMLFCDISPPRARVNEFVAAGAIVLDHHKHAEDVVRAFGECGVFADESIEPGVSGAVLAYREVWKPLFDERWIQGVRSGEDLHPAIAGHHVKEIRRFAERAGVRDTWQTDHHDWKRACEQAEALLFFGYERVATTSGGILSPEQDDVGVLLFEKKLTKARETAERCLIVGRTALFNERYSSDVAEALRDMGAPVDVAVGFAYVCQADRTMHLVFSLRSIGDVDVGAIAAANGGGGHTRAAGFTMRWSGRIASSAEHKAPFDALDDAFANAGRSGLLYP